MPAIRDEDEVENCHGDMCFSMPVQTRTPIGVCVPPQSGAPSCKPPHLQSSVLSNDHCEGTKPSNIENHAKRDRRVVQVDTGVMVYPSKPELELRKILPYSRIHLSGVRACRTYTKTKPFPYFLITATSCKYIDDTCSAVPHEYFLQRFEDLGCQEARMDQPNRSFNQLWLPAINFKQLDIIVVNELNRRGSCSTEEKKKLMQYCVHLFSTLR